MVTKLTTGEVVVKKKKKLSRNIFLCEEDIETNKLYNESREVEQNCKKFLEETEDDD